MAPQVPSPRQERLDRATSKLLASLHDAPIDAASFLSELEDRIARVHPAPRRVAAQRWFRSTRALAASVLILGIVGLLMVNSSSGLVLASPERLARVYEEVLTENDEHAIRADSWTAANAAVKRMWPDAPALPELPIALQYCCLHTLGQKKMICVLLKVDETPVTLAVADAADTKMPNGEMFDVNGVPFQRAAYDGVTMVMSERDGRWICLMGKLPAERLKMIAASIRF